MWGKQRKDERKKMMSSIDKTFMYIEERYQLRYITTIIQYLSAVIFPLLVYM